MGENLALAGEIIPKWIPYKLYMSGIKKRAPKPMVLTYSVTNMCQSRCKTCNLWQIYKKNPKLKEQELKLDEIEKIFKSIRHLYFFNISGGEPFLRKDLPEIVGLACKYLTPGVIHTPTNGLMPKRIEENTRRILDIMIDSKSKAPFTIKPSFDGLYGEHDRIRGVPGNFRKVMDTIKRLQALQKEYSNLHVGLGTVISVFNYDKIPEIADFVQKLNVDTYINEIAEERYELLTVGKGITPDAKKYNKAIEYFSKKIKEDMRNKRRLARFMLAFRLVYYKLVVDILRTKTQVIPCYAGVSNFHMTPYGDIWPCCILGYTKIMGSLRKTGYDFWKVWHSDKAYEIRRSIRNKNCACPFANQAYNNILMDVPSMMKVIKNLIFN